MRCLQQPDGANEIGWLLIDKIKSSEPSGDFLFLADDKEGTCSFYY